MCTSDPSVRISELLPEPTLRRLPWYLAYLTMLRQQGVQTVSSRRLGQDLAVDPSQIAKDLSFLHIKGKTRIGYDVAELEQTLHNFLRFGEIHNAVMMGVGSLGAALMQDSGLHRYGLNIVVGIDTNLNIAGSTVSGIQVFTPDKLTSLVAKLDILIGILAVPVEAAQTAADALVRSGVTALWNFTPRRITVPEGVVVANTSIYSHLAVMYNRLAVNDNKS